MRLLKVGAAILALSVSVSAMAQVHVKGYTKADGTYVPPHERSSPNTTTADNWSTKGNVNPYTGQAGSRDPAPSYDPYRAPPAASPYKAPCYYNCGK